MGRFLLLFLLCSVLTVSVASARTWEVLPDSTGDAPTIQAGIDSASAGDTILVHCGTYYEHDIQIKSGTCLASATGAFDCVTIDAQGLGRVMTCDYADSATSIVGFKAINGDVGEDKGGGLWCRGSDVEVTNCAFRHNRALEGGGGVYLRYGSPVFTNCEFSDNYIWGEWVAGGGVMSSSSAPTFLNCIFSNNGSTICRGGGFAGNSPPMVFEDCLFEGNDGMGGAMYFDGGAATLTGCTIVANQATFGAAGIQFNSPTDVSLNNCIIAFNTGGAAMEWDFGDPAAPVLACCDIYCNAHGDWTGVIADQLGVNGNISQDPLFCDAAESDFHLCLNSPCLDADTCGTMGVYAAGCGTCFVEVDWTNVTIGPLGENGPGSGLAWVDYDGDGDLDIFFTNRSTENVLLRNDSLTAEGFVDATTPVLADSANSRGCPWGDYDNDGDPDLYVSNKGANKLLRNDGNGDFVDVTSSPLDDAGTGQSAAWFDYDNDGDLDIYQVNNGANKLFRNDGSGVFTDVTSGALGDANSGTGLGLADYDSDGDMDIYIANNDGGNVLLENQGGGVFADVTTPVLECPLNSNGVVWGDYDNDGDLDLYVTNNGANQLLRNDGGIFTDVSASPVDDSGVGRGATWFDYDNDGDLDLYVLNYAGANRLFRNDGGGSFEVAGGLCTPLRDNGMSFSTGWGDYDKDGDLDLYLVSDGLNGLFRNESPPGNHWLEVDPEGVFSNRSGIGVRVRIVAGGVSQMREIAGASGFASQSPLTAWFGLGTECTVDTVEVTWPVNGIVQVIAGVSCDQTLAVVEDDPLAGVPEKEEKPSVFRLYPNRPNPFSSKTVIRYDLPERSQVGLAVYDASGRLVCTLLGGEYRDPGRHASYWNGRNSEGKPAAPGIYFCRFTAGPHIQTQRLVLLK